MARAIGIEYTQLLGRIVQAAVDRLAESPRRRPRASLPRHSATLTLPTRADPAARLRSSPRHTTSVNVTILYNEPTLPPDHPDYDQEAGVLESVAAFRAALDAAGPLRDRLGLADSACAAVEHVASARPT